MTACRWQVLLTYFIVFVADWAEGGRLRLVSAAADCSLLNLWCGCVQEWSRQGWRTRLCCQLQQRLRGSSAGARTPSSVVINRALIIKTVLVYLRDIIHRTRARDAVLIKLYSECLNCNLLCFYLLPMSVFC